MTLSKVLKYSPLVGINLLYACVTLFTKYALQHDANRWMIGGKGIIACSLILNIFCMSKGVQVKEVNVIE